MLLLLASGAALAAERVSVTSGGAPSDGRSDRGVLSADGRIVAFASDASNLVVGDLNGSRDVFVRDRLAGVTERISIATSGAEGIGDSDEPALSTDGRFVAFTSVAANLVADDTNRRRDVFVHDRATRTTTRVSVGSAGQQADTDSWQPSISADGRRVAFVSWTGAFDPGAIAGAWLRDRVAGTTTALARRPGLPPDGLYAPVLSADGRVVAAGAWNGQLYRIEVDGPAFQAIGAPRTGALAEDVSPDGRFIAFQQWPAQALPGGIVGPGLFLYDHVSGGITLVSVEHRWLGCAGGARCPLGSSARAARVSDDGRLVAFTSDSGLLDPRAPSAGDQVFVAEPATGRVRLASVSAAGQVAGHCAAAPDLSGDGATVTFRTYDSSVLDPGDTNRAMDVFAVGVSFACTSDADCDDGNPCREAGSCEPASHRCVRPAKPDGTACPSLPVLVCPSQAGVAAQCVAGACAWNAPADFDGDGVCNVDDNCPYHDNADQADPNGNGVGEACDPDRRPCVAFTESDRDGDGHCTGEDDCPFVADPGQQDADGDGIGDVCDLEDGVAEVNRMRIRFRRGPSFKGRILVEGTLALRHPSIPVDLASGLFARLSGERSSLRFSTFFAPASCRTNRPGDVTCLQGSAPYHRVDLHRLTPLARGGTRWRFRMRLEPAFTTIEDDDFWGGPPSASMPATIELQTGDFSGGGLTWTGSFGGCRMSRRGISCRP